MPGVYSGGGTDSCCRRATTASPVIPRVFYLSLNGIELPEQCFQCVLRQVLVRLQGVEEFPSCVCHAMHQYDARPFAKVIIHTVAIGLQVSLEALEYIIGSLPSATRPVVKQDQSLTAVIVYPVKAPVRLAFFVFIQDLDRRFVRSQVTGGQCLAPVRLIQAGQLVQGGPEPIVAGRLRDVHPHPFIALQLAMDRQVVHVFIDDHLGQQAFPCHAFLHHPAGQGSGDHRAVSIPQRSGIFGPDVLLYV